MLNVAVVDDEAAERARIRACLDYMAGEKGLAFCVDEFSSADSFVIQFERQYDIVFMDIEFPSGMDGMAAARAMRETDETVVLIFVTNMARMAVEGYEVEALDFIVKPVEREPFLLKMSRALSRVVRRAEHYVTLKERGEMVSLRVKLIRYLEVDGHYVVYHSREGTFSEYSTMAAAEKKLDDPAFVRCDRGCLVNLRMVTHVGKNTCTVDGQEVLIARTQRTQFLRTYAAFLGGAFVEG